MSKLTEDTLMVRPIDPNKVLAFIIPLLPKLPKDTTYTANACGYDAMTMDNLICVDSDCCYAFLSDNEMFHEGKNQGIICVSIGTSKEYIQEGNGLKGWHNKSNAYNIPIGAETQLPALLKEPVTLKEHMGRRYNYNPRIMKNMREFLNKMIDMGISASSDEAERSVATGAQ